MRSKSINHSAFSWGMRKGRAIKYIIGLDEAGRGPLAGPVVVAGIRIPSTTRLKLKVSSLKLRDSKKLSARQREEWFSFLTNHPKIEWAVARVWPKTIDRINISNAANQGAYCVCRKLGLPQRCRIQLDGGLCLPSYIKHETIIKGDEKIPAIAAASIIAKVTRDRIMLRLHKKYPQYRFDLHKGYGTATHRRLLRRFGYSGVHRRSFAFK